MKKANFAHEHSECITVLAQKVHVVLTFPTFLEL